MFKYVWLAAVFLPGVLSIVLYLNSDPDLAKPEMPTVWIWLSVPFWFFAVVSFFWARKHDGLATVGFIVGSTLAFLYGLTVSGKGLNNSNVEFGIYPITGFLLFALGYAITFVGLLFKR